MALNHGVAKIYQLIELRIYCEVRVMLWKLAFTDASIDEWLLMKRLTEFFDEGSMLLYEEVVSDLHTKGI